VAAARRASVDRVAKLILDDYLSANQAQLVQTLLEWVRIPSISADPAHAPDLEGSARFCAELLRDAGMRNVEVISSPGSAPAVYADWLDAGPGAPTVLVYGHHDVQPVDPLDEWEAPPFEPVVEGTVMRGRGCSDDKGQVLMQAAAVRGVLHAQGRLPVNLKFLIEGEEEVGSPHLEEILSAHSSKFAADLVLVSDTTMVATDIPSTTVGMRGLVSFDLRLRTARSDLHSGIWGGTVPNAARLAARLAAALHDDQGRVSIPGFYDDVAELSEHEAASIASIPFDASDFKDKAGVRRLEGEQGRSPYERTGARPTAEVVGIHSGYGGPGMKTIVPATANLKVAMRLVPDQKPDTIAAAFRSWALSQTGEGVDIELTPIGGVAPLVTPVDHPAVGALSRAIEKVWGKAPLYERSGGSGPEEALGRMLAAPVVFLGVALPEDNFHAPNERLDLEQLWRGILAAGELFEELGRL
jgi:acetylornithine deacetylase/succinyl-diaminopimelate desuccinylase-like protein